MPVTGRIKSVSMGALMGLTALGVGGIAAAAPEGKAQRNYADVVSVHAAGTAGEYQLSVVIESPDTGCERYADWWEVLDARGRLLYRRILLHSHAAEQPFERSGGPVPIGRRTVVWVRAHMHPSGYGGRVLRGSVAAGFFEATPDGALSDELARQPPLPEGCAF